MEHRIPAPGEIQIVVLLGATTFIGWAPAAEVDGIMDSFERREKIGPADRADRLAHARIRMAIARRLRGANAPAMFPDILAAGCLWLGLRHWSKAAEMRDGLAEQMSESGRTVITASIADPAPEGAAPDTAWAFFIGSGTVDGRADLARMKPETVEIRRR